MNEISFQGWIKEVKNDITYSSGCCFIWTHRNLSEVEQQIDEFSKENNKEFLAKEVKDIKDICNFEIIRKEILTADVILFRDMQNYNMNMKNIFLDIISDYMSKNKTIVLLATESFDYESILPKTKTEIISGKIFQYQRKNK